MHIDSIAQVGVASDHHSHLQLIMSAPPKGYYVPAVLFYDEKEEFDVPAIQAHVLRLAQVSLGYFPSSSPCLS